MSVENIKAFRIIGRSEHLNEVVLLLGKTKEFQPDEVSSFYSDTKEFTKISSSNPYSEPVTRILNAVNALEITPEFVKTPESFNPSLEEIDSFSKEISEKVEGFTKKKTEIKRFYNECRRAMEETSHFLNLDQNIEELLSMEYVKAVFGRLPKENAAKLETGGIKNDFAVFIPCSEEGSYTWGVYFVPSDEYEKAERIFSRLYFEKSSFATIDETPLNRYNELKKEFSSLEASLEQINNRINKYKEENTNKILEYYTIAAEYNLYYSIKSYAMEKGDGFCLAGWFPEKNADKLKKQLESIDGIEVEVSCGNEETNLSPPVKLKNCFLVRPFEFYTEMYGVPKYREIDPTAFIAVTYVILFGIMFGDVGHGLLVTLAGLVMWFVRKMPIGKILVPCGVSGMVFGAIYGSVFGFENGMDWLYCDVLGMSEKPVEVMSPHFTNIILYAAVGIGMALLIMAMILNIYTSFRQKNYGRMLFDLNGVAGLFFYGMICAGIVSSMMWNINLFSTPYILTIVLMFVIIFLREPLSALIEGKKENLPEKWGGFIVENLFESFEVLLSYVTNTMSFLRVAAFILVHAGMMQVVFTLAETAGDAGYWPVMVIGNLLVAVLECLLVCIQVLRLEFYEMFSMFYSGEGRPYEPVKLKTTKK